MTLIIGIQCSDGIVMGADGAATLGTLGNLTVLQPVKKLTAIDNSIIVGTSGFVGLAQRIVGIIEAKWTGKAFVGKKSFEAMTEVRNAIGSHLVIEIQYAKEAAKLIGEGVASAAALTNTVLAAPIDGKLRLYQFDCTGAPEEATEDLPFISVGSGQNLADPFLAFLRHVFWKDLLPNVSEGIFAAMWCLEHAIRSNTGGVAEPIQLMTLTTDGRKHHVKEFDKDELEEHRQATKAVEAYLAKYSQEQAESPPEPPAV